MTERLLQQKIGTESHLCRLMLCPECSTRNSTMAVSGGLLSFCYHDECLIWYSTRNSSMAASEGPQLLCRWPWMPYFMLPFCWYCCLTWKPHTRGQSTLPGTLNKELQLSSSTRHLIPTGCWKCLIWWCFAIYLLLLLLITFILLL